MKGKWILAVALGLMLAGCVQKQAPVTVLAAPIADGKERREPVFYNGKMYEMSYRFDAGLAAYALTVDRKPGAMRANPENAAAARAIGTSSLSHFACPTKLRAQLLPNSLRHSGQGYMMLARCGG